MVENYLGDKIAAVAKVHHAIADGMATAEMLEDLMTPVPGQDISTSEPYRPEQPPSEEAISTLPKTATSSSTSTSSRSTISSRLSRTS